MSLEAWTLAIACVTSVMCALCGSLLLVNQKAMISEGLSHAVLPGLVIAFALVKDYNSPWLILAATASGLVMVWLAKAIQSTGIVDGDAGLGIVFSGMFSVGILLVSLYLRKTHFHADCIIDGNLALAPLQRFTIGGIDLGPKSLILMLAILLGALAFILLNFKELKIMLFDPELAQRLGYKPEFLQMIWLALVALATVTSFTVAGSILIVALMIAPPAAAYLLANRLSVLIALACGISIIAATGGFFTSLKLEVAPAGPIAAFAGFVFLVTLVVAPKRGILAKYLKRSRRRNLLDEYLLLSIVDSGEQPHACYSSGSSMNVDRGLERLRLSGAIAQESEIPKITENGQRRLQELELEFSEP